VPFGLRRLQSSFGRGYQQLRATSSFHEDEIDAVELDNDVVTLADGGCSHTTYSSSRPGVRLQPEETEGMPAAAGTSASSPSTARRALRLCIVRWSASPAAGWS
jgi:hypothetical protein